MITARLPYEAPTIMSLLSKHLMEVAVPPSQRRPDLALPPAIDQLILCAMAKDPKVRPATMEAFGEQIAALLASLPVDTAQSTAQRPVPSSFIPVAPTPAAYSAVSPPGVAAAPSYATHGPQMPTPAPAFAPPPSPPPHAQPTQQTRGRGSNKALWIVLAVLLAVGGTVGIVMAMRSSPAAETTPPETPETPETPPDEPDEPETPDPPVTPPTRTDDPWAGGGGGGGSPTPTAPPDPTPAPKLKSTTGGVPECEELADLMERLAACTLVPEDAQLGLKQAAAQVRSGYSGKLSPEVRAQVASSCKMGLDGYQQMVEHYGCP